MGFGSRGSILHSKGQLSSDMSTEELGQDRGNMVHGTGQSKRKWEIGPEASIGHRRRPDPRPPEVNEEVVIYVYDLCADFRGVGDC